MLNLRVRSFVRKNTNSLQSYVIVDSETSLFTYFIVVCQTWNWNGEIYGSMIPTMNVRSAIQTATRTLTTANQKRIVTPKFTKSWNSQSNDQRKVSGKNVPATPVAIKPKYQLEYHSRSIYWPNEFLISKEAVVLYWCEKETKVGFYQTSS